MRKAAIIGVTADGKNELICGMIKYSEARGQLAQHLGASRFTEVFLCEPGKRYRPAQTTSEAKSKFKSKE